MNMKKFAAALLAAVLTGGAAASGFSLNRAETVTAYAAEVSVPSTDVLFSDNDVEGVSPAVTSSNPTLTVNGLTFQYRTLSDGTLEITKYVSTTNTSLIVPGSAGGKKVTSVASGAFQGAKNFTSITIQSGITNIGDFAFADCDDVTEITIMSNVNNIGRAVFAAMDKLKTITVYSANPNYVSKDNVLYTKDMKQLLLYPMNKTNTSYTIPEGVTYIDSYAFIGSSNLASITLPKSLNNINSYAFRNCTGLKSVTIPESVKKMGGGAFEGVTNLKVKFLSTDCKFYTGDNNEYPVFDKTAFLRGCTGSTVESYAKTFGNTFQSMFTWGKDNFNFTNSSKYFTAPTHRGMIDLSYQNTLKNNLKNTEYREFFRNYVGVDGEKYTLDIDDKWNGSCHGIASVLALVKNGAFSVSSIETGKQFLHDISSPSVNSRVASVITYYYLLQFRTYMQQERISAVKKDQKTNINNIISLLDQYPCVVLGFHDEGSNGHSVVAYDYEYGKYELANGKVYTGCLKICDSNYSLAYDEKANLYFRSNADNTDYEWCIPRYTWGDSTTGCCINHVLADPNVLNQGGAILKKADKDYTPFAIRLHASTMPNKSSCLYHATSTKSTLSANDDIAKDAWWNMGTKVSALTITPPQASLFELGVQYSDTYLSGGSKWGKSIYFDPKGIVRIESYSAYYDLSMVLDNNPTSWFGVEVNGKYATRAELSKGSNCYFLSGDKLSDVNVTMYNRNSEVKVSFTTPYTKVKLYEIDSSHIGVMADTDNDGVYDKLIAKTEDLMGDVDGDGKVTAADASLVLTEYADMTAGAGKFTVTQKKLADVNEDGKIGADDASLIITYYAYRSGGGTISDITAYIKSLAA